MRQGGDLLPLPRGTRLLTPDQRHRLEELLREHVPADATERAHLRRIRDFVGRWDDPFDRRLSVGHLTGSAFIVDPAGRLLLTRHRRLGLWIQLGGHAELERDAGAVALREAVEESGLPDLRFHPSLLDRQGRPRLLDVDVHRIPPRPGEPEHDHLDLRFLLCTDCPERARRQEEESQALEWVALSEARRRCLDDMGRALSRTERLTGRPAVP